jgi:hypothetical protein
MSVVKTLVFHIVHYVLHNPKVFYKVSVIMHGKPQYISLAECFPPTHDKQKTFTPIALPGLPTTGERIYKETMD